MLQRKFKLKGKKLYLIYKNIDNNIYNKKEKIVAQLIYKLIYIDYYIVGEETNMDGTINIHCFIELKTPFETLNEYFFDIFLDGEQFHGDYQMGTRKKRIIEFIHRHNNYITNTN